MVLRHTCSLRSVSLLSSTIVSLRTVSSSEGSDAVTEGAGARPRLGREAAAAAGPAGAAVAGAAPWLLAPPPLAAVLEGPAPPALRLAAAADVLAPPKSSFTFCKRVWNKFCVVSPK